MHHALDTRDESLKKYKEYVDNHIKNVYNAFLQYGVEIINMVIISRKSNSSYDTTYDELMKNVLEHDKSKYSVEEFEPYAAKFFPYKQNRLNKKIINKNFTEAWKHHYMNNKHHPEYWVEVKEKMPDVYVCEMICDWISVSMTIKGSVMEWWEKRGREQISKNLDPSDVKMCEGFIKNHIKELDFKN